MLNPRVPESWWACRPASRAAHIVVDFRVLGRTPTFPCSTHSTFETTLDIGRTRRILSQLTQTKLRLDPWCFEVALTWSIVVPESRLKIRGGRLLLLRAQISRPNLVEVGALFAEIGIA